MEGFLFIAFIGLLIAWFAQSGKIRSVQRRNEELEDTLRRLTSRVFQLEKQRVAAPVSTSPPEPVAPVVIVPLPPVVALPVEPEPAAEPDILSEPEPVVMGPTLIEKLKSEDWEAKVGGSWLNAIGMLVLVIGVSALLVLAATELGPVGRIAIGLVASAFILACGAALERRERYKLFGRGLIAGGWALLYFTTYAAHGVDAARIIDNTILAVCLLLAVCAGMIGHSLRYRSQTATALAYIIAFVTLNIYPLSGFAVIASIPLAASLLAISQRLEWSGMAVAGIGLTYATFAFRFDPKVTPALYGTAALWTYWVVFEAFDLIALTRARVRPAIEHTLFPLNAAGFLGCTLLLWTPGPGSPHGLALAAAAAAYLISAILRRRLMPRPPEQGTLNRLATGGYEAAIAIGAALAAISVLERFTGFTAEIALLIEGELLVLAGLQLTERFLWRVGGCVFPIALAHLMLVGVDEKGTTAIAGRAVGNWAFVAVLIAVVFYVNRRLTRSAPLYTWAAAGLLFLATGPSLPTLWVPPVWVAISAGLLEAALRLKWPEFRYQCYLGGVASLFAILVLDVVGAGPVAAHGWPLLVSATLCYGVVARVLRMPEFATLRDAATAAATTVLGSFLWYALPSPLIAVGWAVMSLVLIELGYWLSLPVFRLCGHLSGGLACGRLFVANFTTTGQTGGISHRLLTVSPVIVLHYYFWWRLRSEPASEPWERRVARVYLYSAALMAMALKRFELGRTLTVAAWGPLMVALLYVGVRWSIWDFRFQAYAVGVAVFLRGWATNFYAPESLFGASGRIVTGILAIGCLYAAEFLTPRQWPEGAGRLDRNARPGFALLACALLAVLLYYEVSGGWLSVAWGLEGVALLAAGFAARERTLRLCGLLLFLLCVVKLFAIDLRNLGPFSGILSIIVLGLLLVAASWIYTRFREQIRRYL